MQNQPFPAAITDWTQETITTLAERAYPENTYLEYKRHLEYQNHDDTTKTEWRRDLEREFTAFGNASGGFVVFGMDDDRTPHGIELPDHEVSQSVTQLINETAPPLDTEVTTLPTPQGPPERKLVVVEVPEADRKPVATSDSTYVVRINDHKEPMNREQLESLFVEADRRQQAVRQLEFEIQNFVETYKNTFEDYRLIDAPPGYHLIDSEGLKEVFRLNTHLYADDDTASKVHSIMSKLRDIESHERHYNDLRTGTISNPYEDVTQMNKQMRKQFRGDVSQLHNFIQQLVTQSQLSTRE